MGKHNNQNKRERFDKSKEETINVLLTEKKTDESKRKARKR